MSAKRRRKRSCDPVPLVVGGHVPGKRRGDLLPGGGLVVALGQAGPPTDHLPERPERDAGPVRRRPALMPEDILGQAVEVLLQLPGQTALADARDAHQRDEPRPTLPCRGVIEILEELQLVVATDEGRLEAGPAPHPLASGPRA